MSADPGSGKIQASELNSRHPLGEYKKPNLRKALVQVINTFLPYCALWILMVFMVHLGFSYWILLALIIPASLLLLRIFIFFHDCCHNSFFASRRANRILGFIAGILTFTPYDDWRRSHGRHHNTTQDLDRRGVGDIWTLTVEEYLEAPKRNRLAYRFYRNPFALFGLIPFIYFFIRQRFPNRVAGKREIYSVVFTDMAILVIIAGVSMTIGLGTYLLIQLPIMAIAGAIGVWLFYVQHQFEGVYWARQENWDPRRAALEGSSYYRLPKVLQWFTGNIGLHHIHHLHPLIPNYHLQGFYDAEPAVQAVDPVTIRRSLKSLRLNLWHEASQKMVSFRSVRGYLRQSESKAGRQETWVKALFSGR
jgi:omega-6 fatty acid desaturase (delta-12 desaturase)